MKKTTCLFLSFIILCCESQSNKDISNEHKIFGEWLRKGIRGLGMDLWLVTKRF